VTNYPTVEAGVSIRQPVYDFGRIGGEIEKAAIALRQAEVGLDGTVQEVLFEGLVSFVNLERADRSLAYAQQSEANIRTQTGLEQSRVDMGGGFTSDVLQAKSQLAGAQARLVRAKGALATANHRFRALFQRAPNVADRKQHVPVPAALMPASLEEAAAVARDRNRQLIALRLGIDSGKAEIERLRGAELMPRLNAVGESRYLRNPAGVFGNRTEQSVRLELTYQFNTGFAARHGIDAARDSVVSSQHRYGEAQDLVEEQVRNAWENLMVARENAEFLQNQARIVGQFLALAREERLQGRRSLIDVLSGETSLINAQSDAASAEADVAVATFTLLRTVGILDLAALN
jgi:adhesin transport system outer membrane protein